MPQFYLLLAEELPLLPELLKSLPSPVHRDSVLLFALLEFRVFLGNHANSLNYNMTQLINYWVSPLNEAHMVVAPQVLVQ